VSTQGEPDDRDDNDGLARAKRRGKRYALGIFVSFAAAFIVLSTWEIVAGVFALDAPGGIAAHGKLTPACSVPLRAFAASLDRASAAPDALDPAASLAALDSVCSAGSADLDALAAVKRFVRAANAVNHAVNHIDGDRADAIAPLRRDPLRTDPLRNHPLRDDLEGYLTP
jgi:hypothetical protein